MVFHVACPITCRRICFCPLGFPRPLLTEGSKNEFLKEVQQVEEFLQDPWGIRARQTNATVQVPVPKIVAPPPPVNGHVAEDEEASAQTKRAALQKKAAAMVVAVEDYARRFESGDLTGDASKGNAGEESNTNALCRMCYFGETEGSERARKMLPCKRCGKKYHRSCIKNWAQHRDLFHWSSWTCPSCRICEVCRKPGEAHKLMFCRRCDAAYHCYCQHPPHKNVSSGPYLCPKHTWCHSCGSNVPGNGLSVRWFLGYTCCDACGRLFVKGNYCPVCLKVYRDSESTPMVCCDICQRWVHCQCDGISDEKYQQYQEDGNLQYKCATCRGECYQVKDIDDAVQELWRRRDEADRDLIASLRAAAGLPTQEEIFSISPYSDDDDNGPVISKNEHGRSIKFSLKGLVNKSPKKSSNKKYPKRKGPHPSSAVKAEQSESFGGHLDAQSLQDRLDDYRNDDIQSHRNEGMTAVSSSVLGSGSYNEGARPVNQSGALKHKLVDEVMVNNNEDRMPTLRIKSKKPHVPDHASKTNTVKMKKLVISLGSKKIDMTNPPNSDATSCQREPDSAAMNGVGSEDANGQRASNKLLLDGAAKASEGPEIGHSGQIKSLKFTGREGNLIKLGKVKPEITDVNPKHGGGNVDGRQTAIQERPNDTPERNTGAAVGSSEIPASRGEKVYFRKKFDRRTDLRSERNEDNGSSLDSNSLPKDSKPLLKLRFKKPQSENQDSQGSRGEEVKNVFKASEEEKSSIKGQRSKRKRPATFVDKLSFNESEEKHHDSLMDEIMDANWILKKLGKDGIGKRVEVHQSSDNSWHKGVVTDIEGTSTLYVTLDDGRVRTLELGKQGVRFVSQKQKRSKIC